MKSKLEFITFLSFIFFFNYDVFSSDCPIIFLHGHKSEGITMDTVFNNNGTIKEIKGGLTTWYPLNPDYSLSYHTAMTKILSEHYKGYNWGLTINGEPTKFCDINTQLMPNQGKKTKSE